ncbi:L-type lectin-domain containing receptor kinase IX.1-like [Cornus florida]|uniref:L-type lectin-domain containing receptor kinase IX.1-like n=1 Tax=Cornus florida TaxID=4283 RepID=UPI00289F4002|nr:L-type lectin-domain containing receptor kinase IX.1-like [Cornus florida]
MLTSSITPLALVNNSILSKTNTSASSPSAATGSAFEIHTINSWYFSSELQIDKSITSQTVPGAADPSTPDHSGPNKAVTDGTHHRRFRGLVAGLVASACVLVGGLGLLLFGIRRKMNRAEKNDDHVLNVSYEFGNGMGPRKFSFKELAIATKNFMEEEKLGEGGFGAVYKGFLRELNSYVAVKRVSRGSKQGIKEYASEVKIISRLRHRNLVQLIGWCHEKRELLLVYEFMPNGSLDSHLFKENCLLTWVKRYNVARGLASALLYLHEGWEQCVLHRDIKSSNIMLDSSFNSKLGDFGLARLVDHEKGSQTTVLAGTIGYMAPECLMTGNASKESDVYSFGIVALEIACGRKPINNMANKDQVRMVDWVWKLYGSGKILEAADPRLDADFDEEQMQCLITVGLWCAHPDCNHRPSIKQAIQLLDFEAPLPNLPLKMPVLTCLDPPVNMSAFSLASTSGITDFETRQTHPLSSGDSTDSSKLTISSPASSTAALLLYTQ